MTRSGKQYTTRPSYTTVIEVTGLTAADNVYGVMNTEKGNIHE
jgi:hypothetical protein